MRSAIVHIKRAAGVYSCVFSPAAAVNFHPGAVVHHSIVHRSAGTENLYPALFNNCRIKPCIRNTGVFFDRDGTSGGAFSPIGDNIENRIFDDPAGCHEQCAVAGYRNIICFSCKSGTGTM